VRKNALKLFGALIKRMSIARFNLKENSKNKFLSMKALDKLIPKFEADIKDLQGKLDNLVDELHQSGHAYITIENLPDVSKMDKDQLKAMNPLTKRAAGYKALLPDFQ
jgi:low affinity Fe/Cu permease